MNVGSWATTDKLRGFHSRYLTKYKNRFYKNVTPTNINKFKKIIFDNPHKLVSNYKKSNITKNSINIRTKLNKKQKREAKSDNEYLKQNQQHNTFGHNTR